MSFTNLPKSSSHAQLENQTKSYSPNSQDSSSSAIFAHRVPNPEANLPSMAPEIVLQIFESLWYSDDLISSACLGATCKAFKKIEDKRAAINARIIRREERIYRALTSQEQIKYPKGVMVISPSASELLRLPNPQQIPQPEAAYADWRGDLLLKREPNTQVFSLYQDVRGCNLEALFKTSKDSPWAMDCLRSARRKAWQEYLKDDHEQSIRIHQSVVQIGEWTPRRILFDEDHQSNCVGRAMAKLAPEIKFLLFKYDALMSHPTIREQIANRDEFIAGIVPLIRAQCRADRKNGR